MKYFPHYDSHLQGERAARMLVRAIRGDYKPATVTQRVPIISPTVLQWTGASPWMDLVQRALTWEAREPDVYVNFFFGFPFADVPDVGMTFQVMTNGDPGLARRVADDMAAAAWRQRKALIGSTKVHTIPEGVTLAKQAMARDATPVVLADHSDRSGSATWILKEVIEQDLSDVLIATIADAKAIDALKATGVKAGDPFDMEVGGLVDESAGAPVRVQGTVLNAVEGRGQLWVVVKFGRGNVLVLSRYLVQVMEPGSLSALGLDVSAFKAFAIKSRVHFRRGFDDSGFAKTILLVEPVEPFLGTVRLEGLPYQNVDLKKFYPYGDPQFPVILPERGPPGPLMAGRARLQSRVFIDPTDDRATEWRAPSEDMSGLEVRAPARSSSRASAHRCSHQREPFRRVPVGVAFEAAELAAGRIDQDRGRQQRDVEHRHRLAALVVEDAEVGSFCSL